MPELSREEFEKWHKIHGSAFRDTRERERIAYLAGWAASGEALKNSPEYIDEDMANSDAGKFVNLDSHDDPPPQWWLKKMEEYAAFKIAEASLRAAETQNHKIGHEDQKQTKNQRVIKKHTPCAPI